MQFWSRWIRLCCCFKFLVKNAFFLLLEFHNVFELSSLPFTFHSAQISYITKTTPKSIAFHSWKIIILHTVDQLRSNTYRAPLHLFSHISAYSSTQPLNIPGICFFNFKILPFYFIFLLFKILLLLFLLFKALSKII